MLEAKQDFEALLNYLKHSCGCDLTRYKHSTLMRRFAVRMLEIKIDNYQDYLHYLQNHPQESTALLDTVLINVTNFFRDRDAWDYLADKIIPQIIANKEPQEPIRVWSAACASGEEVYSLMMLFAEALGIESCLQRVKCYATDIDEAALEQAQQGFYQPKEVKDIPPHLLEKYFEQTERGYVFHPTLRSTILFGRHNLAEDAPMSKIDLLACRNALMYFNLETQATILIRFHFALKNNGFLFLGNAETASANRPIFTPVNLKHRIFAKGLKLGVEEHLQLTGRSRKKQAALPLLTPDCFWKTAFETSPFAQLALDFNNYLILANKQANALFSLTFNDVGRPLRSLNPGKVFGLYTAIKQLHKDNLPVTLKHVEWIAPNGITYFDIFIAPVFDLQGRLLGVNLTFTDVTGNQPLQKTIEQANLELTRVSQALEEAKAQLDVTQAELESTQKELETVYEEMQFIAPTIYRRV